MAWRYMAYRATTQTPLDLDLPISVDELGWALSGAGALRGTVTPDIGNLRAADGRLLLEEWGTLIFAENAGEIRWGGIVVASSFEGETWNVEAAGFSSYPHGMTYMSNYSKIGVDPAQVVKDIWAHLQAQPDGDLNVVVTGDKTPIRLGKPGVKAIPQVYLNGKWHDRTDVDSDKIEVDTSVALAKGMKKTDTSLTLTSIGNYANIGLPFEVKVGSERITVGGRSGTKLTGLTRGVGTSTSASHGKGTKVTYKGTPTRTIAAVPAEPFTLSWWEAPDCGEEIANLASETPFDFVERHRWSGDDIVHEVEIGYPRIGTRRTDIAFVQGDNVISVVAPSLDGDDFANVVLGLGAGDGSKTIHRTASVRDGRLRRTAVYTAKNVKKNDRMDARVRDALARHRNVLEISEVTVRDHDNARIGSWGLGDDVLIEATIPWLGNVSVWSRITGWSLLSEDTARLSLSRSDKFTYGG